MKDVFGEEMHPAFCHRTGCTLTCRRCGKREFFEGGFLHSLAAAKASQNWTQDSSFVLCTECFNSEHP